METTTDAKKRPVKRPWTEKALERTLEIAVIAASTALASAAAGFFGALGADLARGVVGGSSATDPRNDSATVVPMKKVV